MTGHKIGFEGLKYEFRYNSDEKAIELEYSFMAGVPAENRTVIDMNPVAQVLKMYPPKHKGRKPEADRVFDDPQTAQKVTEEAEKLFSIELGWAIDKAIQLLFHEVMGRSGLDDNKTTIRDRVSNSFKNEMTKRFDINRGRKADPQFEQDEAEAKRRLRLKGLPETQANVAEQLDITVEAYRSSVRRRRSP